MGYSTRHMSTTVLGGGAGVGGKGGLAGGDRSISLEVTGIARPDCVVKVRIIPRILVFSVGPQEIVVDF